MRVKDYFKTLILFLLAAIAIYDYKALAEIINITDKCIKPPKYATAENISIFAENRKNEDFDIKSAQIVKLCKCIKFSSANCLGDWYVMKNKNRLLVASRKYSSPVYYTYSCKPEMIHYTVAECEKAAVKTVSDAVPDTVSGKGMPYIINSENEGLYVKVILAFSMHYDNKISVRIRRDTLNVVHFDARKLYFN